MSFYPQERTALFIDGSNLYAAARALGFDIDYKRLLEVFKQKGQLIRAFLLHGIDRGPGVFPYPTAGRLARL